MWNFHLDMEFADEFFWQLNLLDPTFKLDAYTWHGSGLKWKIRVQKKRDGQSPGQQVLVNLELFVFLANLRSRVKWEAKMTFVNLSPRAKQEAKRVSKISLISNNTIKWYQKFRIPITLLSYPLGAGKNPSVDKLILNKDFRKWVQKRGKLVQRLVLRLEESKFYLA